MGVMHVTSSYFMQSPESRENIFLDPEVSWKCSLKTELAGEVLAWSLRIFLRDSILRYVLPDVAFIILVLYKFL